MNFSQAGDRRSKLLDLYAELLDQLPVSSRKAVRDNIIPARRLLLHARSPKLGEILKFSKGSG